MQKTAICRAGYVLKVSQIKLFRRTPLPAGDVFLCHCKVKAYPHDVKIPASVMDFSGGCVIIILTAPFGKNRRRSDTNPEGRTRRRYSRGSAVKEKYDKNFLKKVPLFSSLTDEDLESISSKVILRQFRKNDTILYEEDTNEYMYIIRKGKVKVVRSTEDGKEIILAMHGAGSFFGEMSLIDGKTTPASVIATEDSLIAIIAKNDFFSIIFSQNKVAGNLLQILCARLRKSWDTIQLLNFNNAAQRTKMLFYMLSDEYGEKTPDGKTILNIRLTHQDISDMTGLTRETVTRVIDRFQKNNEITVLKNRFICLGRDFLRKDINNILG